ncbi:hypothetical protein [Sphingobium chungbukense]|uniref:Uncharacterized protein n=1 Tax=Sphingobium chungbukense TaxID=56193 RepID=A0A0M3AMU6_9SPHN|nr:hypothetical protein [Sphingobium chungbukense]KKW91253.1 hypothetical protein YP76_16945 [Sphingobium chungbukense]
MATMQPFSAKLFHSLLIQCIAEERSPTDAEIDSVASKIWQDSHGATTGQDWLDVARGSDAHVQMINAARMAFGCHEGAVAA